MGQDAPSFTVSGALHALTQVQGDRLVTLMGEVPSETLLLLARALTSMEVLETP